MDHYSLRVEQAARLDKALAALLPDFSRTRLQALIKQGCVTIAGAVVLDANTKVQAEDVIEIYVPDALPAKPQPQIMPLDILFEDQDLIVINKPSGLVVHPASSHQDGTLVNALLAHCGESLSGIGGVKRPGIVHRLDKDTTGVMVVAKNDAAHHGLSEQFADHGRMGDLERLYVAFAWGAIEPSVRAIEAPLARDPRNAERRTVKAHGKWALTELVSRETLDAEGRVSEVALRLKTGRTHQIRVHLAHIGHPLLGDPVYGSGFKSKSAKLSDKAQLALTALKRQALHAAVLGFAHPRTGKILRFEAPLPDDMRVLRAALRGA